MSKEYTVTYELGKKTKTLTDVHPDDSIDTLKRKIIKAMDESIAYDEIYLFIFQHKEFFPEQLYAELSQNGRIEVTFEHLSNFLVNFVDFEKLIKKLKSKDVYTIGDLYELQLDKPHID